MVTDNDTTCVYDPQNMVSVQLTVETWEQLYLQEVGRITKENRHFRWPSPNVARSPFTFTLQ